MKSFNKWWAIAAAALVTFAATAVVLVLANPFATGSSAARQGDSAYAVNFDGEQYIDSQAGVKTQNASLVRDPEEQYASPESRSAAPHRIADMPAASTTTAPAAGARTTKELRAELRAQKQAGGNAVQLAADGSAIPPIGAPDAINGVIAAGNAIKNFPYIWGGGHASFQDNGYDCSGSVSYALAGGGLLSAPLTSGQLAHWGASGPGKWITIYANAGHVFMFVGGLRFDTSFRDGPRGSRWQDTKRSLSGFAIRHPVGL